MEILRDQSEARSRKILSIGLSSCVLFTRLLTTFTLVSPLLCPWGQPSTYLEGARRGGSRGFNDALLARTAGGGQLTQLARSFLRNNSYC